MAPESQNLRYAGLTIMRDHQIFDKEVETRPVAAQQQLDKGSYQEQIAYLMKHSVFYQEKLAAAGFNTPEQVGGLDDIAQLPFTEKDELRASQVEFPPFGKHIATDDSKLRRVFSTSGTTGVPCYLGLTQNDLNMYATNVARGYSAAGFTSGQRLVVGFNAGPFVAGAVYYGFDKIGCNVISVGRCAAGRYRRKLHTVLRSLFNRLVSRPRHRHPAVGPAQHDYRRRAGGW